jgi:uncharacterized membrane protein YciS (DUF1049 family)
MCNIAITVSIIFLWIIAMIPLMVIMFIDNQTFDNYSTLMATLNVGSRLIKTLLDIGMIVLYLTMFKFFIKMKIDKQAGKTSMKEGRILKS